MNFTGGSAQPIPDNSYRRNHYVSQWYQKRFLPPVGEQKFHYLNLAPDTQVCGDGITRKRKAINRWGTVRCFYQDDLYTTQFGPVISTEIERDFFGPVDNAGTSAVEYFSTFQHPDASGDHLHAMQNWMSLQKLRTPKGLASLRSQINTTNPNYVLFEMQRIQNIFCATWAECVWQIADASQSQTKFILSDHPVTVYNPKCLPGSPLCNGIIDPDIRLVGTHTIVPLSLDKILILTNLGWARDPYQDPRIIRRNPTLFRTAIFNFLQIQTNRMLSELEVRKINYITKLRAHRYVAAPQEDWLYPERHLRQTGWYSLSLDDLLMPDPRAISFSREHVLGFAGGRTQRFDEYGRRPQQVDFSDERAASREWNSFQKHQGEYAKRHGPRRRGRAFEFNRIDPEEDSPEMHRIHLAYLQRNRGRR